MFCWELYGDWPVLKLREGLAMDLTVDFLYTERVGTGSKSLVDLHFLCSLPMDPVIFLGPSTAGGCSRGAEEVPCRRLVSELIDVLEW